MVIAQASPHLHTGANPKYGLPSYRHARNTECNYVSTFTTVMVQQCPVETIYKTCMQVIPKKKETLCIRHRGLPNLKNLFSASKGISTSAEKAEDAKISGENRQLFSFLILYSFCRTCDPRQAAAHLEQ